MPTQYPKTFNYGDALVDSHANRGDTINITSTISGDTVRFKPFIKSFNDSSNINFSSEEVFGRMDDLLAYKNTKRTISIAFDVPSYSEEEAKDNFIKAALLKNWIYPEYSGKTALSIKRAPLFRVKYMNLIFNSAKPDSGLLGVIDTFSFAPDLGEGSYVRSGIITPKTFAISLSIKVQHEVTPQNNLITKSYPYNVKIDDFANLDVPQGLPQGQKK